MRITPYSASSHQGNTEPDWKRFQVVPTATSEGTEARGIVTKCLVSRRLAPHPPDSDEADGTRAWNKRYLVVIQRWLGESLVLLLPLLIGSILNTNPLRVSLPVGNNLVGSDWKIEKREPPPRERPRYVLSSTSY